MRVTTESGTIYEFEGNKVRRAPEGNAAGMRRDEEWLSFTSPRVPTIGEDMFLLLEPLGEGNVTVRRTTPVVLIEGAPE